VDARCEQAARVQVHIHICDQYAYAEVTLDDLWMLDVSKLLEYRCRCTYIYAYAY
jgi:hypothetical protein